MTILQRFMALRPPSLRLTAVLIAALAGGASPAAYSQKNSQKNAKSSPLKRNSKNALRKSSSIRQGSSLPELIRRGLMQNKGILAASRSVSAAKSAIGSSSGFPDPVIGGQYFTRPIETKAGPQVANFKISQKIPWPGKLSAKENVESRAFDVAGWALKGRQLDLKRDITIQYYQILGLQRQLQVNVAHANLVDELNKITLQKIRVGTARQSAALALAVQRANLTRQKLDYRAKLADAVARLENLTGQKLSSSQFTTEVAALRFLDFTILEHPGIPKVSHTAKYHPDIQRLKSEQRRVIARHDAADIAALPDITVNATWYQIKEPVTELENRDAFSVGAAISLPLFGGKFTSRQSSLKEAKVAARLNTEQKMDDIRLAIDSLVRQLLAKKSALKIFSESIEPLVQQAVDVDQRSYRQGNVTIESIMANLNRKIDYDHLVILDQVAVKVLVAQLERHLIFRTGRAAR